MKTIGLLGGMSWESTVPYYRIINTVVKERLGGLHSAKLLLYSVDFHEIEECQSRGDWDRSAEILSDAARGLEKAGADLLAICTNTMHKVAPQIHQAVQIPLVHIADATAAALREKGVQKAALLGTRYTMEQDFYKSILVENGIEVLIPDEARRRVINDTIFDELCRGIVSVPSRRTFLEIIEELADQGAQGVILGCTEIGLLVRQEDTAAALFDTTVIHATRVALDALDCRNAK